VVSAIAKPLKLFYADTLCHAVTLTLIFDPLTLKVYGMWSVTWSKSALNLRKIEQSPAELLIILLIFAHVMLRCYLDLWPLELELLQHFGCYVFKLRTKFEQNRIIHGWVTDDLARFCHATIGVGHNSQAVIRGVWSVDPISPNLARK